jgi:methionyl-tRNA synthetase
LLTGTDEHGQKILRTAIANDTTPQAWADSLVESAWKPLLETIQISNDDFIRTTDERHEVAVAKFLQQLHDDDHIFEGEYEGYYCVGCEEYTTSWRRPTATTPARSCARSTRGRSRC